MGRGSRVLEARGHEGSQHAQPSIHQVESAHPSQIFPDTERDSKESLSFTDLPTYCTIPRDILSSLPPPKGRMQAIPEENQILSQRFRLIRHIASGEVGRVYEAIDLVFGGTYALKILHPWVVENPHSMHMVIHSLKLVERLQHPGIARCYLLQRDEDSSFTFYPMEFITGMSLSFLLKQRQMLSQQGTFSPLEVLQIIEQLAPTLSYIHKNQQCHGNLKPTNVMFPEGPLDPPAKLLDFGCRLPGADALESQAHTSSSWMYKSSPDSMYYISHRQRKNKDRPASPADDIFALGVMAYQMLTGELPVAMAPPPSSYNAEVTSQLDKVLACAMHSHLDKAFRTVPAFTRALREAIPMQPSTDTRAEAARPSYSSAAHPAMSLSRQPGFQQAPLPNTSSFATFSPNAHHANQPPRPAPQAAPRGSSQALQAQSMPGGWHHPSMENLGVPPQQAPQPMPYQVQQQAQQQAQQQYQQQPPAQHQPQYQQHQTQLPAQHPPQHQAQPPQQYQPQPPSQQSPPQAPQPPSQQSPPQHQQLSRPMKSLRRSSTEETMWDTPTKQRPLHPQTITGLSLHPQGLALASASGETIKLWNTQSWQEAENFKPGGDGLQHLCWSANGRFLAFVSQRTTVQIWDWNKRRHTQSIVHNQPVQEIALSADGYILAVVTQDHRVHVWNAASGEAKAQIHDSGTPYTHLALEEQGHVMVLGSRHGTIELWDLARCNKLFAFPTRHTEVNSLRFVSGTSTLLSGHKNADIQLWDYHKCQLTKTYRGHKSAIGSMVLSPHVSKFVSAAQDGSLCLWSQEHPAPQKTLRRPSPAHHLCIHPQGHWIASVEDNMLLIWDLV